MTDATITFQAIDKNGLVQAEATFKKGRVYQPATNTYLSGFRLVDTLCGVDFGSRTFFTEPIMGGSTGIVQRNQIWNHVT